MNCCTSFTAALRVRVCLSKTSTCVEEFRGKGIGKALMAEAAAIAVREGYWGLRWEVLDWNQPAIDFYRKLGATFPEDWKQVYIDGEPLRRLAESAATDESGANYRRRLGRVGGGVAVRAAGRYCGIVRDAAGALDSRASDRRFRRIGVLEFAEVRQPEYRPLAAERRDAARGIAAAGNCPRVRRARGTCAGRGSHRVCAKVTETISREPLITIRREEVTAIDESQITVIATGAADL